MQIQLHVHDDHCLLSVSGLVGTVDVPRVRAGIRSALDEHGHDVLVDLRQAGPVSDHLGAALVAAAAVAGDRGRYVAVIDAAGGAAAMCLRRQRAHLRVPVYRDSANAVAGLRARRSPGPVPSPPPGRP